MSLLSKVSSKAWFELTNEIERRVLSGEPLVEILFQLDPYLLQVILEDSQKVFFKDFWIESLNFQDSEQKNIVLPALLNQLLSLSRLPQCTVSAGYSGHERCVAHAGILHTYGYLFSNLCTKHGFKRERWTEDILESGFGLPSGILGPHPAKGSLFSNVTYFLARWIFQNDPLTCARLESSGVPDHLAKFDYFAPKWNRIREEIRIESAYGERRVVADSDLIPFLHPVGTQSHFLIYSIKDSARKQVVARHLNEVMLDVLQGDVAPDQKLVTGFPVSRTTVDELIYSGHMGENVPITMRYNAFVPDISDAHKMFLGKRMLWDSSCSELPT